MHGRDEKCTENFGPKNLKGRDHLEGLGVDGRMIYPGREADQSPPSSAEVKE
jgi:hypothetical protein